jgi:hypothetical protein
LGNTSNLNNHLKEVHHYTNVDHKMGKKVTYKVSSQRQATIDQYTIETEPTLYAKEALFQFIVLTNQPFSICDSQAFKNLYISKGAICPIENGDSCHNGIGAQFDSSRRELKLEMGDECITFSISFDGWSTSNHIYILGVIAY